MGGEENGGSYCFSLLPSAAPLPALLPDPALIAYVDAEDPNRSSWARYINHAAPDSAQCNARSHVNAEELLVWFTAARPILAGEEIAFDYQATVPLPITLS
jgi:hypothetical protein